MTVMTSYAHHIANRFSNMETDVEVNEKVKMEVPDNKKAVKPTNKVRFYQQKELIQFFNLLMANK